MSGNYQKGRHDRTLERKSLRKSDIRHLHAQTLRKPSKHKRLSAKDILCARYLSKLPSIKPHSPMDSSASFCFCLYAYPYLSPRNNMIARVVCLAVRTWHPHPLDLTIVEILEKKGAMTDEELFDVLRETRADLASETWTKH